MSEKVQYRKPVGSLRTNAAMKGASTTLTLSLKRAARMAELIAKAVAHSQQRGTDEIEVVVLRGESDPKDKQVLFFGRNQPRVARFKLGASS